MTNAFFEGIYFTTCDSCVCQSCCGCHGAHLALAAVIRPGESLLVTIKRLVHFTLDSGFVRVPTGWTLSLSPSPSLPRFLDGGRGVWIDGREETVGMWQQQWQEVTSHQSRAARNLADRACKTPHYLPHHCPHHHHHHHRRDKHATQRHTSCCCISAHSIF